MVSGKSVQYTESLSISDKWRYLEKTRGIGDPYGCSLSVLSQDDLLPVRSTDIKGSVTCKMIIFQIKFHANFVI